MEWDVGTIFNALILDLGVGFISMFLKIEDIHLLFFTLLLHMQHLQMLKQQIKFVEIYEYEKGNVYIS